VWRPRAKWEWKGEVVSGRSEGDASFSIRSLARRDRSSQDRQWVRCAHHSAAVGEANVRVNCHGDAQGNHGIGVGCSWEHKGVERQTMTMQETALWHSTHISPSLPHEMTARAPRGHADTAITVTATATWRGHAQCRRHMAGTPSTGPNVCAPAGLRVPPTPTQSFQSLKLAPQSIFRFSRLSKSSQEVRFGRALW
jgi:hypothetical protein